MASLTTLVQMVVNETDITTPTSTLNGLYVLGQIYSFKDSSAPNAVKQYMYIKANGALTQYQPYRIVNSGTSGAEWTTASFISLSAPVTLVGIPQVAFTSGYYGFIQIGGVATYKAPATTVAAGASLKAMTSGTALVVDSSTGVQSNASMAWNVTALTSDDTSGSCVLSNIRFVVTS